MTRKNYNQQPAESIYSLLSKLPDENNNDYTVVLRNLVLDKNLLAKEDELLIYMKDKNAKYRFSAFYALLIICREYNNYSKYNLYVDTYGADFCKYKLYKIVMSTYYRNKAILGEKEYYRKCIRFAEEACTELPDNLAVKHHYAAMIVLAIEDNIQIDSPIIEKAIDRLDDVISVYSNHPVYYSTQGRLYASIGKYARGIEKIKKALDLEEAKDKDSMIRIGEYNYYLLQIKMMMENNRAETKINEFDATFQAIKNDLDSVKTQYLEYLAFFASVLAFILISIDITIKTDDFNKCAGIILMFAGSLVIAFSLFRMLLYYSSKVKFQIIKNIICFASGILLIVVGFLLGNQILMQWLNIT